MNDRSKTKAQLISELADLRRRLAQAEEAARSQSDHGPFRTLVEATASAIFIWQDSVFRYTNPAFSKLTGYTAEEIRGTCVWDLMHPDYREVIAERVLAWQRGEPVPPRSEFQILMKSGGTRWIDADSTHIEFDGRPAALTIAYDSTGYKHAEQSLNESKQHFSKIIETAQEAIWIVDATANSTYVNQRLADMLGYTRDELLGRSVFDFIEVADRAEMRRHLERGRSGVKEQRDVRLQRKDGSEVWTMASTTPLFDSTGSFNGGLAMLIDITERRRSEEALRQSEDRWRAYIQQASDLIFIVDGSGRIVSVNNATCEATGYTAEEMLGKTLIEFVIPEQRAVAMSGMRNRSAGVRPDQMELEILSKDGRRVSLEIRGTVQYDGDQPSGAFEIARDITERKRAQEALKESEAKFRVMAETTACAIFIYRGEKLVYANPAAEGHTGYSREELLRINFADLVHPEHRELVRARARARQRGESVPPKYEFKILTRSGETKWVEATASPLEYEGEPAVLGTAFDITDHKRAEEEVHKTQERLQHVLALSPATIYLLKPDGQDLTLEWMSEGLARLTGYELNEALAEGWWVGCIHPDDLRRVLAEMRRLLTGDHVIHEYRFRHKNGHYLWLHDETRLVRDEAGNAVEAIGSWVDVSERREAETALRESEERFRSLVGSMDDLVFTVDREGRYSGVFGRWLQRFKIDGVALIGKTAEEILGAQAGQLHDSVNKRGLSGEQVFYDWSIATSQGTFYFQTCLSPIRDGSGDVTGLVGVGRDITARKRADEALRASEERYRDLVENARDIIYSYDLNGKFTSVNRATEQITGYGREEALKLNIDQIVAPESLGLARQMIAAKLAGQKETAYELEIIAKDGRRLTVEVNTRAVREDDVPTGIQGVARDVTERKLAEEALRKSEERFRRFFELGLVGMAITSPAKGIIEANDKICEILGYQRSELLQLTWEALTYPDDLAADLVEFDRMLAGEAEGYSMDKRYIRKTGEIIHATISVSCVRRSDRSIDYVVGLLEDITERKLAEKALRESEVQLQAILDNCPAMIFEKNLEGHYLRVNQQFERTFSLTSEQVLGRSDDELFPPEVASVFRGTDHSVFEEGRPLEFEESAVYGDGIHTYIVHKFPLLDGAGKVYSVGGISTDITARKRAEDDLRRQKEILEKIFDHIPVMIRFLDENGRVKLVNREWERTLGWSLTEIESRDLDIFAELYPDPEYRRQVLAFVAASTGEFIDFRTTTRNGRVIDTSFANVRLEDGTNIGIGRDITERKRAAELLSHQSARLAALRAIELEISAESDLSRILEVVTQHAAELLNCYRCGVYILDQEGTGLELLASLDKALIGLRVREDEGLTGMAAMSGHAQAVDDYSQWEGRRPALADKGLGPALSAPLKWQQTVIGAISLARGQGETLFSEDDIRLVEQIAADAAIAIHQARLFEEVEEGRRRLQVLSHRLIDAHEAERKRLARELHDQIGQALTAVQISLQSLRNSPDIGANVDRVQESLEVIDDALQQVHDLSLDLRPSTLDDIGLVAALRWYGNRITGRAGLTMQFTANDLDTRVASAVETACFRISQEALTNVLRHAHASRVSVEVTHDSSHLRLQLKDDGVGFDVGSALRRTGPNASLGLQGMRERAAALDGVVVIESKLGRGTTVEASFPLTRIDSSLSAQ